MISATASLNIFTHVHVGERTLARTLRTEVSITPGVGRIYLDVSRGCGFERGWQKHIQWLYSFGRANYSLPWSETNFHVSAYADRIVLDGASASLPVFVAWIALLSSLPLPRPFLATGCAVQDDPTGALAPAPCEFIAGKLSFAQQLVRQAEHSDKPAPIWIPSGSDYDASTVPALLVREVATLPEAVRAILGLETH